MQIDSNSKMIYVHIPRTGGSWFTYSWKSHTEQKGKYICTASQLVNTKSRKTTPCGNHGRLLGILEQLKKIDADVSGYKVITLVRHPIDRILSSWSWFSEVKETAKRMKWKTIDDMLDSFEQGRFKAEYMPQTYWLCQPGVKWDHIFRFEDALTGAYDIKKVFPEWNPKKSGWLSRQGRTKGYKKYLTNNQINRIKKLYSDDIKYLAPYYEDLNR